MPEEPTRFDHDLDLSDDTVVKTDRYERMRDADLRGLTSALIQGFILEIKATPSGHLYAALLNPTEPMTWGNFSGLRPAVYAIAEGFEEQVEGELPGGPPIEDPSALEKFVLAGGTVLISWLTSAYQVELRRHMDRLKRRQGARWLNITRSGVRRFHAEDLLAAIDAALEEPESVDEVLSI